MKYKFKTLVTSLVLLPVICSAIAITPMGAPQVKVTPPSTSGVWTKQDNTSVNVGTNWVYLYSADCGKLLVSGDVTGNSWNDWNWVQTAVFEQIYVPVPPDTGDAIVLEDGILGGPKYKTTEYDICFNTEPLFGPPFDGRVLVWDAERNSWRVEQDTWYKAKQSLTSLAQELMKGLVKVGEAIKQMCIWYGEAEPYIIDGDGHPHEPVGDDLQGQWFQWIEPFCNSDYFVIVSQNEISSTSTTLIEGVALSTLSGGASINIPAGANEVWATMAVVNDQVQFNIVYTGYPEGQRSMLTASTTSLIDSTTKDKQPKVKVPKELRRRVWNDYVSKHPNAQLPSNLE